MSNFRIREARMGDKEAIGALWRALMLHHRALDSHFTLAPDAEKKYLRHTHEMIRSREARVLVAEDILTGEVIAFLMGELQSRPPISLPGLYGFISDVYVQAAWRHHGVGKALFEAIHPWFLERKATAIELFVATANPDATAFWESLGLQPLMQLLHLDL